MLVRDIIRATAQAGDLTVPALLAMDSRKGVSHLRHAGILASRRLTRQSLPALGRYWGGRDHTTVRNSILKAEKLIADGDQAFHDDLLQILSQLGVKELPGSASVVVTPSQAMAQDLDEMAADIAALEGRLARLRFQHAQLLGLTQ